MNQNDAQHYLWKSPDGKRTRKHEIFITKKRRHFRAFDKIVNTQIDDTKITYYYNMFQNYKLSMKKPGEQLMRPWQDINNAMNYQPDFNLKVKH